LGIAERVEFVGDIADADLPAAYADADVFVLPANARAEAFGTVLLEAMATGLPVISTDLGTGTSWVNQDGVTGRVVAASDPEALAQAVSELVGDLTTRQRMGQAARARVESDFSLPVMIQGVEAVYVRALQNAQVL
jgi:rhamnosyl/mannosyltransferase